LRLQIGIGIVIAIWAALLLISGITLKPTLLKPFSLAIGIAYFVLLAFDLWLWRIPFIARLLHQPVLRGTWKGRLVSNWTDPATGTKRPPIEAFLVVQQTYSSISLRIMTEESSSRSLVASLDTPRDDVSRVSSTYQNIPRLLVQDRSRIHHGTVLLEVQGTPANRLVGSYWTDRDTKGELEFDVRSEKIFTGHDEASKALWKA